MKKFDNSNIDALYNDYVTESVNTLGQMAALEVTLTEVYNSRPKAARKVLKEALMYTRAALDLMADNWKQYLHTHFIED